MARISRWIGVSVLSLSGCVLAGCMSHPDWALPKESFASLITDKPEPRVARPQMADGPAVTLKKPLPPPPNLGERFVPPPPPPGSGAIQTSLSTRSTTRVSIRAWVNCKPIFDEEVMQSAGPQMGQVLSLPEPQRSEKLAELINTVLEQLIESELLYQDAVRKLVKGNPTALDKLKEFVDQEFDKSVQRMRSAGVTENQIRELEPVARRLLERNLISSEYVRSRVRHIVESRVGLHEVREYYEAHKNEFQTVDKIVWQDIFIPVSPNLPTVEDAKRFGEDLINRCRKPDDFNRLMVYNEGDSKGRNGEGLGQRKGEIRPAELEAVLFQLDPGQIGPVVPFSTGVHLVRVLKRDYAGQLPLDEQTQKTIRRKLENQLADREYRRVVHELRTRAVVRIEKDMP